MRILYVLLVSLPAVLPGFDLRDPARGCFVATVQPVSDIGQPLAAPSIINEGRALTRDESNAVRAAIADIRNWEEEYKLEGLAKRRSPPSRTLESLFESNQICVALVQSSVAVSAHKWDYSYVERGVRYTGVGAPAILVQQDYLPQSGERLSGSSRFRLALVLLQAAGMLQNPTEQQPRNAGFEFPVYVWLTAALGRIVGDPNASPALRNAAAEMVVVVTESAQRASASGVLLPPPEQIEEAGKSLYAAHSNLVTVDSAGMARLWDLDLGLPRAEMQLPAGVSIATAGSDLLIASEREGVERVDVRQARRTPFGRAPGWPGCAPTMIATDRGLTAWVVCSDHTLRRVSRRSPSIVVQVDTPIHSIALGEKGELLAVGLGNGLIQLRTSATGEQHGQLEGPKVPTTSLAISADESSIVGGFADGTIRLWRLPDGGASSLARHKSPVVALAVDPTGRLFASQDQEGTTVLWSLEAESWLHSFASGGCALAFIDGGNLLAISRGDLVELWDVSELASRDW